MVSKLDGTIAWTLVKVEEEWAMGYALPIPLHWSKDGLYFFFINESVPDGCGLFRYGSNLQRVELENGQVTEIAGTAGIGQAISPDDSTLALIKRSSEDTNLVIQDLATKSERQTSVSTDQSRPQAGSIVWSPDGSQLVLTLAHEPCGSNWTQSIVKVDVETLSQVTLVEKDERRFRSSEWIGNRILLVNPLTDEEWWLDVTSGQISAGSKPLD